MVNLPLFFLYFAEVPHTKKFSMKTRNMYKPQPRGWKGSLFYPVSLPLCLWVTFSCSLSAKQTSFHFELYTGSHLNSFLCEAQEPSWPRVPIPGASFCWHQPDQQNPVVGFQRIKFYFSKSKKPETFLSTSPFIQCISYYMILNESI